jgi:hypothetical protein
MTNSFAAVASFRRLAAGERKRLLPAHLLCLDGEDRRLRFGGHTGEERVRACCAGLDRQPGALVLGCFVGGELCAVGELKPIPGAWPPAAEFAVSVGKPFRGRGLGAELCRRLVVRAQSVRRPGAHALPARQPSRAADCTRARRRASLPPGRGGGRAPAAVAGPGERARGVAGRGGRRAGRWAAPPRRLPTVAGCARPGPRPRRLTAVARRKPGGAAVVGILLPARRPISRAHLPISPRLHATR